MKMKLPRKDSVEIKYWTENVDKLNQRLSKLWFEARTISGDHYTKASLDHFRYGINGWLVKYRSQYNIVDGPEFKPLQLAIVMPVKSLKNWQRTQEILSFYCTKRSVNLSSKYDILMTKYIIKDKDLKVITEYKQ